MPAEDTPLLPSPPANRKLKRKLNEDINSEAVIPILSVLSFTTGFLDAISYATLSVWAGFQTGNSLQLSLALSRLTATPNSIPSHTSRLQHAFRPVDQIAIASLVFFNIGAHLGGYFGSKRVSLILGSGIQTLLTVIAAVIVMEAHTTTQYASLCLIAFTLGMQGIQAKKLGSSVFGTSLVLTSAWVELMNANRRSVINKSLPIISLIFGGFVGGAVLRFAGAAAALGIVAMLRGLVTATWFFVQAKA
uniref:DUF1275 domain protein n=1 Tax=Moniliophthora roreri TaxID=221103 RepID=A0A0W0G5I8_MONRR